MFYSSRQMFIACRNFDLWLNILHFIYNILALKFCVCLFMYYVYFVPQQENRSRISPKQQSDGKENIL
jgi:hypothetical protein